MASDMSLAVFLKHSTWIFLVLLSTSVGTTLVRRFTCPQYSEYCTCTESHITNPSKNRTACEGQGLTQIPTMLPDNVKELKLTNTIVARIPPGLPISLKMLYID